MTPKTMAEIQQLALAINSPDQPFGITAAGTQIVGHWNILDAKWLGLLSANSAAKDYTITFDLDAANHQFSYTERDKTTNATAGTAPGGGISLGGSSSFFKGKEFGTHDIGMDIGFGMKDKDKPVQAVGVVTYNFSNAQIKDPIMQLLQQSGWTEKKAGIFKKLFG